MPVLEKTKSATHQVVQHHWPAWIKNKSESVYVDFSPFFIWVKMLCSILQKETYNVTKMLLLSSGLRTGLWNRDFNL